MSMRVSKVYGRCETGFWHGWDQMDEEDLFILDFTAVNSGVASAEDHGPHGFTVKMPLSAFKAIVEDYIEQKRKEAQANEIAKQILSRRTE